jgi:hypothetical protein
MTKLSEKVMGKITKENIMPIPKWQFLLKSKFVWAMAICSVIFGAVAVAISLHLILSPLDSLPAQSPHVALWESLAAVPYFWLILIGLFIYVAYHNFIHTEDGYKWKTFQIFGATIAASVVLGVVMLFSGFAPLLNTYFIRHIPGYTAFGDMRGTMWMNPTEGRLAGQVIAVDTRINIVTLRDLNGKVWKVTYTQQTYAAVSLSVDEYIKILGTQTGSDSFTAIEFRPWEGKGMMRSSNLQGNRSMMRITR